VSSTPPSAGDDARPVLADQPAPGVTRLLLNRPPQRNAVDAATVRALAAQLKKLSAGVVIIGSSTPLAFCSGADLSVPDTERAAISDSLYALYAQMLASPVIIIASIHGAAIGAGAQLAVASDLRIGSQLARFRFAGPGHGLAVGAWGLPSLVGRGRAAEICLSMRWVAADEAQAIGLLERVVEDSDADALRTAQEILRLDAGAVQRLKRLVTGVGDLSRLLEAEGDGNHRAWDGNINGLNRGDGPGDE
jgi:enoyl-CoA hydratase